MTTAMDFSIMFFSSTAQGPAAARYALLRQVARFADRHGYCAVWTPERHFHPFGGLFPNPAVTSAALAMITERVQLRAGSIVLPLHHPVRVVEEWAMVDNLSEGRAAISIASGWHANDFVLAPDAYARRHEIMWDDLATIRALWRGEPHRATNGRGEDVAVTVYPPPVQPTLPVWVTAASSVETFVAAGRHDAHVLTFLLGQTRDQLAGKIARYREARREAGLDPAAGQVAVMLHTFVGDDTAAVKALVREPMRAYLRTATELSRARPVSAETMEEMLTTVFEQYFDVALMGTVERCRAQVAQLAAAGVDEIACMVDFGLDEATTLAGLQLLNAVKRAAGKESP